MVSNSIDLVYRLLVFKTESEESQSNMLKMLDLLPDAIFILKRKQDTNNPEKNTESL
jgi:hypothetical protein